MGSLATSQNMFATARTLILALAILISGVLAPTLAHAGVELENAVEHGLVADGHHANETDPAHQHDVDDDTPCHAVTHHHCSAAMRADDAVISLTNFGSHIHGIPVATLDMPSRSQEPPTQPPAA